MANQCTMISLMWKWWNKWPSQYRLTYKVFIPNLLEWKEWLVVRVGKSFLETFGLLTWFIVGMVIKWIIELVIESKDLMRSLNYTIIRTNWLKKTKYPKRSSRHMEYKFQKLRSSCSKIIFMILTSCIDILNELCALNSLKYIIFIPQFTNN